ncbi:MAG: nucleotide-binding domain containing protein [Acidocella sp.]|nr:nucleotide-binding domain containing protein [Acidocella sp.]
MSTYGLAATLRDAIALVGAFGPGRRLGRGVGQASTVEILIPQAIDLTAQEVAAAVALGRAQYFFTFGNQATIPEPASLAPMIDQLTSSTGVGFMAACLADPALGRTMYQGHLFESGRLRGDMVRAFGTALEGSVGLVAHATVAAGALAIRRQCRALKEQGKTLALIDAINDDDCSAIIEATSGLTLRGGAAWLGGQAHEAAPPPPAGPVAILSGALDRQTIFQIGAARCALPVFDLEVSAPGAAAAALAWAADKIGQGAFIISSSVPPDKITAGAPAAAIIGDIAKGLVAGGVRRFVIAGCETAHEVLNALGIEDLKSGAGFGPLAWLENETLSICVKPGGIGAKGIFLTEFEPQICRNGASE